MEPIAIIALLGMALIATGSLVALLPVATCPQCEHCKLERMRRELEDERWRTEAAGPYCQVCGRHHPSDDRHF